MKKNLLACTLLLLASHAEAATSRQIADAARVVRNFANDETSEVSEEDVRVFLSHVYPVYNPFNHMNRADDAQVLRQTARQVDRVNADAFMAYADIFDKSPGEMIHDKPRWLAFADALDRVAQALETK